MAGLWTRARASFNILVNRNVTISPRDQIATLNNAIHTAVIRDTTDAVLAPIITRIAMDVAGIPLKHIMVDEFGRYESTRKSELNDRLNFSANIDQTGAVFIQDVVTSILKNGSTAIVPIVTSDNPDETGSWDIYQLRHGNVEEWMNRSVRIRIYNENEGDETDLTVLKSRVAIVYNPLYLVMNEQNSTLNRLIDKLSLLDREDNNTHSTALDLILQLPIILRGERFEEEIKRRRDSLISQLTSGPYGVAYVDSTEKIHQMNRPVTNNLIEEVRELEESLYKQLGLTPEVFAGTASEEEMLAYYDRTIRPIIQGITQSMSRAFLTKTARTQGQDIGAFYNVFKMASLSTIAESADKFTRNEILSSNEFRQLIGFDPSDEEGAGELRNKNLNRSDNEKGPKEIEPPKIDPKKEKTDGET